MTYFLERIASHLLNEYSNRLNKQCLVFPNRRAGLYFLKYLSVKAGKTIWSPPVKTINELFTSYSNLNLAESETLIFELYRVYKKLNPKAESFDEFYFWGELLINDFDDVDKYLVDASELFANLSDIKKIDSEFGTLTPEQVNTIRQFWVNFDQESPTDQKTDFLNLWILLPQLYLDFRSTLRSKGIAYEGMIFRDLAETCKQDNLRMPDYDCFHFIGFNALNTSEKTLMKTIRKAGKAKFYWDYDNSFVKGNTDHSAGFFLKQNLMDFGNDMPADWDYNTFLSKDQKNVKRKIIETSSDIAQVKLVAQLLDEMPGVNGAEAHHTAVILSDENLLVPLLSSIPESIDSVNVTMGYPLKFSPVYSLLHHLLNMQKNIRLSGTEILFDHKDVLTLLKHNYFADSIAGHELISEIMKEKRQWIPASRFTGLDPFENIFLKADTPALLTAYLKNILEGLFIPDADDESRKKYSKKEINIRNEFIYRTLLALNRLDSTVTGSEIQLTAVTFSRLLDKVLRGLSIPFTGEPLNGIQIMGILETRTLDFKNLVILSVNEGVLPRSSAGSSYIPHNLREAFGLTTIRHQDSIYSYYFYRLLQRSDNVIFIFNSNSEGLKTGEMSRFLLQLKYLNETSPEFVSLGYQINSRKGIEETLVRTENHHKKLIELFLGTQKKLLSPSAVNTWLACRMQFYYKYVCRLKEPEKIVTEVDNAIFGELLHSIMEKIYNPMKGSVLEKNKIESVLGNENEINAIITEVISLRCHGGNQKDLAGNDLIISSIISSYLKMVLRFDSTFNALTIKDLEKWITSVIEIQCENKPASLTAGGRIDRLDFNGGIHRIVDYKTGYVEMEIDSVLSLFDESDEDRNEAWFQILMYCELFYRENPFLKVRPSMYALRRMSDHAYSDKLIITKYKDNRIAVEDYSQIRDEFAEGINSTILKIFSRSEPFIMTGNRRKCDYCPFRQLCQR
jgi:hypothetical protein